MSCDEDDEFTDNAGLAFPALTGPYRVLTMMTASKVIP